MQFMNQPTSVRFGIVGLGNMGNAHAKNILDGKVPGLKLTAIADTNPEKAKNFPYRDKMELHLIGHLQSNKARKAVKLFDVIQTIDSIKLAERINAICAEMGTKQRIFIQVNTGNDPAKQGFTINNVMDAIREISKMKQLIIGHITFSV